MTEHTPGPWVWENDHVLRSLVEPEPQDSRVLSASRTIRGEAADLSLIAAAPALLAAAEAFVVINECACPTPDDMPYEDDLVFSEWIKSNRCHWHKARAAISQARGEA